MTNDFRFPSAHTWKYVDDTTVTEIVPRCVQGDIQSAVGVVEDWSREQNVQLNAKKCKELIIDFKKNKYAFSPIVAGGNELSVVNSARILGVTISYNLKWNEHVSVSIKKANKHLYYLALLKRADDSRKD